MHGKMVCFSDMEEEDIIIITHRFIRDFVQGLWREAAHYAKHPAIVGWQIDNEINCEVDEFYSEADSVAFREFLRKQYGTLEKLNEAWGTTFWNQTYTAWDQIYVLRPVLTRELILISIWIISDLFQRVPVISVKCRQRLSKICKTGRLYHNKW